MFSLKNNYELQSVTPTTSNPCSDCHCGRLADTKRSMLVSVYARAFVRHQEGSGTCCSSKPGNAKGWLQVATGIE